MKIEIYRYEDKNGNGPLMNFPIRKALVDLLVAQNPHEYDPIETEEDMFFIPDNCFSIFVKLMPQLKNEEGLINCFDGNTHGFPKDWFFASLTPKHLADFCFFNSEAALNILEKNGFEIVKYLVEDSEILKGEMDGIVAFKK